MTRIIAMRRDLKLVNSGLLFKSQLAGGGAYFSGPNTGRIACHSRLEGNNVDIVLLAVYRRTRAFVYVGTKISPVNNIER